MYVSDEWRARPPCPVPPELLIAIAPLLSTYMTVGYAPLRHEPADDMFVGGLSDFGMTYGHFALSHEPPPSITTPDAQTMTSLPICQICHPPES